MAWTSPRTWAALEKMTAALLNTELRDNLLYLYSRLVLQRLSSGVTPASNTSTGETDLMSYTLPGGTLTANGQSVDVVAYGTSANNSNVKTLKLKFGGSTVLTTTIQASATPWAIRAHITRTGAATQVCVADASGVATTGVANGYAAATETLSGDVSITVTGQSDTASADITQVALNVRLVP